MNMMTKMNGTAGRPAAAELLRSARVTRGYSIDDVALTCGLTADEVQAVESGADDDAGRITRVAAALGLSADDVLPSAG
ncbi:helix-turn-helix transcriptional regulator [Rhizobium sp. RU36D]|uniref:helix-turn-helix domain-containing protein n=1 Tax=Rhizobium sp. RU36D TaxID=1907415 RepID=UPI0009D8B45E|nr:helix-turn-helix transcriptional regulator [Rhizobium sp. RU36D]SMD21005.1 transcriptional regulator [Rhizobium sp. RU36D]